MSDGPKVLIIDDDRDIVRGLAVHLRAAGCEVLTARDGALGLEIAIDALPDIILLDVSMPGLDGIEVLTALRSRDATRDIPAIVLSANVVEQTRARAAAAGARRFLEKPFRFEKLMSTIQSECAGGAGPMPRVAAPAHAELRAQPPSAC